MVRKILDEIGNKKKGLVLKEFEKVCPTDTSFNRIKKEMHDIYEEQTEEIVAALQRYFIFEEKE